MKVPLIFRHKGKLYSRDALQVIYAQGLGWQCLLKFKNGEVLTYPYPLGELEKLVSAHGYVRVHKSYVLCYDAVADIRWKKAILYNGDEIPLCPEEYERLKTRLENKLNAWLNIPWKSNFPPPSEN